MQENNKNYEDINLCDCILPKDNHVIGYIFHSRRADYFQKAGNFEREVESILSCLVHYPLDSYFQERLLKIYLKHEQFDQALDAAWKYANEAMKSDKTEGRDSSETLHKIGDILLEAKQYKESIQFYQKAIDCRTWEKDDWHLKTLAKYYICIAKAYEKSDNSAEALEYYKKCIDTCCQLNDSTDVLACCYRDMSRHYRNKGQYTNALDCAMKAYEIWKDYDNEKEEIMNISEKIGHIYFSGLNQPKDAIEYYRITLSLAEELVLVDYSLRVDLAYRNLAQAFFYSGDYQNALPLYQKAIKINSAKFREDDQDKVWVLAKIGRCCAYVNNPSLGIEAYTNAIEMHKRLGLTEDIKLANYYDDLGVYYDWEQNEEKALNCFQKAYEIASKSEGEMGWTAGYALFHLAQVMKTMPNKRNEALQFSLKAKESFIYQKCEKEIELVNDLIDYLNTH